MLATRFGAGLVLAMFVLGNGAESSPPETKKKPGKPALSRLIDQKVKSINGYSGKDEAEIAGDGEFLRRIMLDLVGYPPSGDQVKVFILDKDEEKRAKKIDQLLASEDFADLWTRKFMGVFFGNYHNVVMDTSPKLSGNARKRIVKNFENWFKMRLAKDTGWNYIVFDILDARGKDEGDPALAYKLSFWKGEGHAIEFASGVSQHFLCIRLLCARCHDHPFAGWKVKDYYGLAAFNVREKAMGYGKSSEKDAVEHVDVKYAHKGEMMIKRAPPSTKPNPQVILAKGGKAGPTFLFGGQCPDGADRARYLAMAMTSKGNRWLPLALSNRVWKWLFGTGLVEPVDDFKATSKPLSMAVLKAMANTLKSEEFSLQTLIRGVCNSDTYQRSCSSGADYTTVTFHKTSVQPLSGEQLINAIWVATTGKPVRDGGAKARGMIGSLFPAGSVWCEVTPLPSNAQQALLLRNNGDVNRLISNGGEARRIRNLNVSLEQKVVELFMAVLCRMPNQKEFERYLKFIKANSGFEDAMWTLMNTTEFVTKH